MKKFRLFSHIKRFKLTNLRARIALNAILIMIASIISVSYVSYVVVKNIIIERVYHDNYNYIKTIASSMENLIVESSDKLHFLYETSLPLINEYYVIENTYEKAVYRQKIESELQYMLEINKDFKGAILIGEQNSFYRGDIFSSNIGINIFRSSSMYDSLKRNVDSVILLEPDERDIRNYKINIEDCVLLGKLSENENGEIILLVAVSLERSIYKNDWGSIALYSNNGQVLWSSGEVIDGFFEKYRDKLAGTGQGNFMHDRKHLISYYNSTNSDLHFVNFIPENQIENSMEPLKKDIVTYSIIICIPFLLFTIALSSVLLNPLIRLKKHMKEVNDFNENHPVDMKATGLFASWLSWTSIKTKLIVYYCFNTILPAGLLIIIIFIVSQKLIIEEKKVSVENIIKQTESNLSITVNNMQSTVSSLSVLDEVQMLLSSQVEYDESESLRKILSNNLVNLKILRKGIAYLNIYDKNGSLKYSTQKLDEDFRGIVYKNKDNSFKLPDSPQWLPMETDFTGNIIFSYLKPIYLKMFTHNTENNKLFTEDLYTVIGYIEVGLLESFLQSKYQLLKWGPQSDVFIIDTSGTIVSHMEKNLIGKKVNYLLPDNIIYGEISFSKENSFIMLSRLSQRDDWGLIAKVSDTQIIIDNYKILIYNTYLLLIIIFINSVLSRIISRNIILPLKSMQKVFAKNALDARCQTGETKDEIYALANSFNRMMERLNHMVNEVYRAKLVEKELKESQYELSRKKNEAELIAFQSQINPHFLYNTFSSIIFMINMGMHNESIKMLDAVGKMFRKGVYRGEVIVNVRDEVEHVKAYVDIQKVRYQDKLEVEMDVADKLYDMKMLKLTLQPLVENSIYHGIELKEGKGTLTIKGWTEKNKIYFSICDDGVGMDSNRLNEVRKGLEDDNDTHSIGLRNVNVRIKLYYGEEYGLEIDSEKGKGTRAVMCIPVVVEGERKTC